MGLKVLITNATLATRTGTETYVRDLALGLLRKGHSPVVYAPELGAIADELRRHTIPVVDNLNSIGTTPDIIHGNHNTELITALSHFERAPAVFYCHSWRDWISSPPLHPRILAYVAVDDTCRDRLLFENGIPERQVRVQLHVADLERFRLRKPLPDRPAKALIFSNTANNWTHLSTVREACKRTGIDVDVVGSGVNASSDKPEFLLPNYDLVFAKGRCALEALAVGTAVILCDAAGSGPLVTTYDLERLRRWNFGIRTLSDKVDTDLLVKQIARYDAEDATVVSQRIRSFDLGTLMDEIVALYNDVIDEGRQRIAPSPIDESRAVAEYLRWMTLAVRKRHAEYESMLTNSVSVRLRNRVGRFALMNKLLNRMGQLARRNSK